MKELGTNKSYSFILAKHLILLAIPSGQIQIKLQASQRYKSRVYFVLYVFDSTWSFHLVSNKLDREFS